MFCDSCDGPVSEGTTQSLVVVMSAHLDGELGFTQS